MSKVLLQPSPSLFMVLQSPNTPLYM